MLTRHHIKNVQGTSPDLIPNKQEKKQFYHAIHSIIMEQITHWYQPHVPERNDPWSIGPFFC